MVVHACNPNYSQRQFEASLGYTLSSKLARATRQCPVSKGTRKAIN
ncbi:rCG44520, partial [Rattus norvegicus]